MYALMAGWTHWHAIAVGHRLLHDETLENYVFFIAILLHFLVEIVTIVCEVEREYQISNVCAWGWCHNQFWVKVVRVYQWTHLHCCWFLLGILIFFNTIWEFCDEVYSVEFVVKKIGNWIPYYPLVTIQLKRKWHVFFKLDFTIF